jgi:methylated-DNA-protein-cysteine methyltransferase-like protein
MQKNGKKTSSQPAKQKVKTPVKRAAKPTDTGKNGLNRNLASSFPLQDLAEATPRKRPDFYGRVYAIVEQIPRGKVTTYGAIAEVLGMKGSSRMVGQALGAVPEDSDLPAQRVINRIGALSGAHHFGGYDRMRRMLEKEGVTFKREIVDMEKHFWSPKEAIELPKVP